MMVLSGGLTSIDNVKKKMTAEYLAQEGVEYTRNVRDSYFVDSIKNNNPATIGWGNFTTKLSSSGCSISLGATPTLSTGCLVSSLEDSTLYLENPNVDTGFTRKIYSEPFNGGDSVKITAVVYWDNNKSASFSEVLYNWLQ